MEEKESTVSGSPGNSETDSPPPVSSMVVPPQVMNMNMNMNMAVDNMGIERSFSVITTPATIGSGGGSGGLQGRGSHLDLSGKKKRGRPRKYDSDGNLRVQPFQHTATAAGLVGTTPPPPPGFSFSPSSPPSDHVFSSSKRGRGRPPGSGNWQLLASLGEFQETQKQKGER